MTNKIKERPILFKAEMARAILDGQKSQTRRILKEQPKDGHVLMGYLHQHKYSDPLVAVFGETKDGCTTSLHIKSPYGSVGDRLWVRETFVVGHDLDDDCTPVSEEKVWYKATDPLDGWYDIGTGAEMNVPWKPSIFMPRWASRITLEITAVKIERLNDLSRGDCMAEGCPFPNIAKKTDPKQWYNVLWESINGNGSWDKNQWVWVYEFKKIDELKGGA